MNVADNACAPPADGTIVLINEAWSQAARASGAAPGRCDPGVNYLRICRTATGPFAERAVEAARGIETVLRGAAPHFSLDYPCPSPSRNAWFRLVARPESDRMKKSRRCHRR